MYALLCRRVLKEERGELGLGDRGEARVRPAHVALPVRVLRDVRRCPNLSYTVPPLSKHHAPFVAGVL